MLKNIPPITRNLLFINIILFMVQQVISVRYGDVLTELFGLHFVLAPAFRIYQPLTYMFLHASWSHVLFNMFSLWMFGRIIEETMGQKRFIIYYLVCGVGAAFCHDFANVNTIPMSSILDQWVTIGASGACYGVLLAFGMTFPNQRIMLLIPPIPMKAKYFVIGYALIEAYSAFTSNGNVAHFAHLGGMLFGWFLFRYWRKQNSRGQSAFQGWNNYQSAQTNRGYNGNNANNEGGLLQQIRMAFEAFGASLEKFFKNLFSSANPSSTNGFRQQQNNNASAQAPSNADQAYNAQRRAQREKLDKILEKVRRSGYASLTEEEKKELFNNSRR